MLDNRDDRTRVHRARTAARLPDGAAKLHTQSMFDWNDLTYFLAVARHGSTIAAGKALGLSQSTVHRRLSELERRLGHKLVTRHTTGYRLTPFGEALLPYAEHVEAAIKALERHVSDATHDAAGIIRVTCPEPIVYRMTALIDRFHAQHPKLRVEFVTDAALRTRVLSRNPENLYGFG